jgi:hypothetical protein
VDAAAIVLPWHRRARRVDPRFDAARCPALVLYFESSYPVLLLLLYLLPIVLHPAYSQLELCLCVHSDSLRSQCRLRRTHRLRACKFSPVTPRRPLCKTIQKSFGKPSDVSPARTVDSLVFREPCHLQYIAVYTPVPAKRPKLRPVRSSLAYLFHVRSCAQQIERELMPCLSQWTFLRQTLMLKYPRYTHSQFSIPHVVG